MGHYLIRNTGTRAIRSCYYR